MFLLLVSIQSSFEFFRFLLVLVMLYRWRYMMYALLEIPYISSFYLSKFYLIICCIAFGIHDEVRGHIAICNDYKFVAYLHNIL